jgi:hypothetical protein
MKIDSEIGAPQATIFREYKLALMTATALDLAIGLEERAAHKEGRPINPENIDLITRRLFDRMSYKAHGCRYHSFVIYFSMLQKLLWVEPTGQEETSEFQDNYPQGQPRKYFRITEAGKYAGNDDWANPHKTLYG